MGNYYLTKFFYHLGILLLLVAVPHISLAADLLVTRTDDPAPDGCLADDCSLREAIIQSNSDDIQDTITLPAGKIALSLSGTDQDASAGDLNITKSVTITGAAAGGTIIDADKIDRIFQIDAGTNVDLKKLTLEDGQAGSTAQVDGGGAILNLGFLNLIDCTIQKSVAVDGGAIYNQGILVIERSTLSANGIFPVTGQTATTSGGAIYQGGNLMQLMNSTLSGNAAVSAGGGIYQEIGTTKLFNVTITDNEVNGATSGGGIHNANTTAESMITKNSIIAQNSGLAPDCAGGGGLSSQGNNIIGDNTGCSFTQSTEDQVGTSILPLDPKIGLLADNKGLTLTHALEAGSPALEAGSLSGCAYEGEAAGSSLALIQDQRGFARPWDNDADGLSRCDIGAFERGGCGDGVLDGDNGEECDQGTANSNTAANACRIQCKNPSCGDGVIDDTETCDDKNVVDGDGCSALCQIEVDADSDGDTASVDCNDNDPLINTKATEKCDSVDNDCDKEIDEGFGIGAACTNGVGACQAAGTKICAEDGLSSTCNAVAGAPGTELCGNVIDDDCDGESDEGFDVGTTCSVGVGACNNAGQKVCTTNGQGTECNAAPLDPGTETCNGVDDDCDGTADEDIAATATACGVGTCAATGTSSCVGGKLVDSCAAGTATTETCDGLDNDCDGTADEDIAATATACGVGACAATGSKTCQSSKLVDSCAPLAASSELCGDNLDNDCDGTTDEGFDVGTACSVGIGACQANGTKACSTDKTTTTCNATAGTATSEICDGLDNDCDGTTDEDIAATSTTCGVGACATTGSKTCQSGKLVDSCTPLTVGTETCGDGIDQDCNGSDLACSTSSSDSSTDNDNTDSQDQTDDTDETDDTTNNEDSTTSGGAPVTENVPPTTTDETTTNTSSSSGGCSLTGTPDTSSAPAPFALLLLGLGIMTKVRQRVKRI